MASKKQKQTIIFLIISLLLVVISKTLFMYTYAKKQDVWVNVFVHGSFGTMLGLLSLPRVLADDVHNSMYHQLTKKMRQDATFFSGQPILQRGLTRVYPTFNIEATGGLKLAAYPILKAYDLVMHVIGKTDINWYYTFGWSGLVSQHRRKFEAIRLYNALTEEIARIQAQGFNPKIRLLAHSHGGNLCLNLAMIPLIQEGKHRESTHQYSFSDDAVDSLKKMSSIIESLNPLHMRPNHMVKKYDYLPCNNNFVIDELVLLGTPIQVENAPFIASSLFKRVYNIYSEKDVIQELDWVSTKQRISSQRISDDVLAAMRHNQLDAHTHLIQAKIMYDRPLTSASLTQEQREQQEQEKTLWSRIFKTKTTDKDPSHKDLWFFSWADLTRANKSFATPLPTVVFIPFIKNTMDMCHNFDDIDINLTQDKDLLVAEVYQHNHKYYEITNTMPSEIIDTMKQLLDPWSPQGKPEFSDELSKIYHYLQESLR